MEKNQIVLLLILIIGFIFYISDKPIVRGGSMVGKIRVNGTANKVVKKRVTKILGNSDFYAINLPQATSDYLINDFGLKPSYDSHKKLSYMMQNLVQI